MNIPRIIGERVYIHYQGDIDGDDFDYLEYLEDFPYPGPQKNPGKIVDTDMLDVGDEREVIYQVRFDDGCSFWAMKSWLYCPTISEGDIVTIKGYSQEHPALDVSDRMLGYVGNPYTMGSVRGHHIYGTIHHVNGDYYQRTSLALLELKGNQNKLDENSYYMTDDGTVILKLLQQTKNEFIFANSAGVNIRMHENTLTQIQGNKKGFNYAKET